MRATADAARLRTKITRLAGHALATRNVEIVLTVEFLPPDAPTEAYVIVQPLTKELLMIPDEDIATRRLTAHRERAPSPNCSRTHR